MSEQNIIASDLHVKTLEYLVELWDKDLLPDDMKKYVMEEVPILKLLENSKQKAMCTIAPEVKELQIFL